ncbi:unnamed protein product [Nezara viridula]|uniref:Uncharacterized protein n=1 Tax=Nezara viridula TaxID=85310 RepID=A0A9P0GZP5_NEZVI|nr:unnamed protein product [Nezara viridula]
MPGGGIKPGTVMSWRAHDLMCGQLIGPAYVGVGTGVATLVIGTVCRDVEGKLNDHRRRRFLRSVRYETATTEQALYNAPLAFLSIFVCQCFCNMEENQYGS